MLKVSAGALILDEWSFRCQLLRKELKEKSQNMLWNSYINESLGLFRQKNVIYEYAEYSADLFANISPTSETPYPLQ